MRPTCSSQAVNGHAFPATVPFAAALLLAVVGCADRPGLTEPAATVDASGRVDAHGGEPIVVGSSAELVAALSPANAGRTILVRAGTYAVSQLLVVPDGATLEGEGRMLYDGAGRPTGFATGSRTTITMTGGTPGDVLTLGDGASVRRIAVEDLPGRSGSVIAVVSRGSGDRVSATIAEVDILNPNAHGVSPLGPTGCGITVLTLNPNVGVDTPPHAGAEVSARVRHTIVRSPALGVGCAVFAFNFAPSARVSVSLADNVLGGGLLGNGGVSRPDLVHDSRTEIQSHRNLYRDDTGNACLAQLVGWNLQGASGPPIPLPNPGALRNTLRFHSVDDRIEGFARGILATGGRSFFAAPLHGPVSGNHMDLRLQGTTISTAECAGAPPSMDLRLAGMLVGDAAIVPGDDNTMRVVMRGVTASGPSVNLYAHVLGPTGPQPAALQGTGNRLVIVGSPQAFEQTNHAISPAPGAEFFTSGG